MFAVSVVCCELITREEESMPPVEFEPKISEDKRSQIYALDRGYTGARTDTTQQTNICLGIHRQTRVATFNPTCLSRLIATATILSQNQ